MSDWIQSLIFALSGVIIFSAWYQWLPARKVPEGNPGLAIFPKYWFPVSNQADFLVKLQALDFKQGSSNSYSRGHMLGDFFARWMKLTVKYDAPSKTATIGSPLIVIAFDTGDVWKLANQLKG